MIPIKIQCYFHGQVVLYLLRRRLEKTAKFWVFYIDHMTLQNGMSVQVNDYQLRLDAYKAFLNFWWYYKFFNQTLVYKCYMSRYQIINIHVTFQDMIKEIILAEKIFWRWFETNFH